ncbi:multicopper oxidase domain-containing protein [Piscicoccus intestinalis]|uniref:multicopper oxidase domain-containing protein n=1 Tax=Piscicoccus intestinalis TaxID=746033 RepID=UPI0008395421|nr:multicopper oxidase domain-containing protein [Piscicoccus intestinalis]
MTTYHVVATSMPIVYTREGDHDPNGMLFAPAAHVALLDWVRELWELGDERLPRLHTRRQHAQIVVDALGRLEEMLHRLRTGPDEDVELLADLIRRESVPAYGEPDDRLALGPRRRSHRAGAVRANVEATLAELRQALDALGVPDAPEAAEAPDAPEATEATEVPEPVGLAPEQGDGADTDAAPGWEPERRLVTLTPAERAALRAHWRGQLRLLDAAIAQWFARVESDPARRFDADRLAERVRERTGVGLPPERIARLLLNDHRVPPEHLGDQAPPYDRFNPMRPVPIVEPLVLRTRVDEPVTVHVRNSLRNRRLGFHVQGDGLAGSGGAGVRCADGACVADNPDTTIAPGDATTFTYAATHEGVWPINDLADVRGSERGTNAHGLFGALIVEPAGTTWRDPVSGDDLTGTGYDTGLYVDVIAAHEPTGTPEHRAFTDFYSDEIPRSFREYTVFMHDEPEVHSALHAGEHTTMPLSYRAEPMGNRLPHRMRRYAQATPADPPRGQVGVDRRAVTSRLGDDLEEQFWTARTPDGRYLERVAGEEQHHSSWLFGEPVTPVLRGYTGDPFRLRLVHAGVKETHVFHLHVHQWRAVPQDVAPPGAHGTDEHGRPRPLGSQLLDSITIGPQAGVTIDPLYGVGSRQHAVGDVIWHCHLYPHFHHGMWGLVRGFDRLVDGTRAYPDGTPCPPLVPLPGREPPCAEPGSPGFPWFVDGVYPMKSPPPPAPIPEQVGGRRRLLGMPPHSPAEYAAMAPGCRDGRSPGAVFVDLDALAAEWNRAAGLPAPRVISYDLEVGAARVDYNADGWHDRRGHRYRLLRAQVREPRPGGYETVRDETFEALPGNPEPAFPRANHGDIVEWRFHNALGSFAADDFDLAQAPVECGLHVHLVKFDVLAADGSATGWNYLSGASCREAVGTDATGEGLSRIVGLHRWVVDEEFGPCFFHDHLLANYRQKHGLWAALVAQPHGSLWQRPDDQGRVAWSEPEAVVVPPPASGVPPFREACLGVGDFVPLLDRGGRPLNPPGRLSGDDDPGSMAVNYRSAPLTHRGDDPSLWFSTAARSAPNLRGVRGDPETPVIAAYPGERVRIRLIQGSHEEQHSFTAHGLRWRADWGNPASPLVNQQTIGISEAFTLDLAAHGDTLGVGDHLWHFGAMDDLWTGCWGYLRVLRPSPDNLAALDPVADLSDDPAGALERMRTARSVPPRPRKDADGRYRDDEVRTVVVVARRREHEYAGRHLTDPWGLQFHVAAYDEAEHAAAKRTGAWRPTRVAEPDGPLVLRARRGQWVRVFLVNELLGQARDDTGGTDDEIGYDAGLLPFGVEPSPPRLPLEHLDAFGRPDRRTVSPRVSLHPGLVSFDVDSDDGAYVGRNHDGTVAPARGREDHEAGGHAGEAAGRVVHRGGTVGDGGGHDHDAPNWTEYWWYCDEALAPASHADGPGSVCHLQDMADVRNHRHHGLVGALVVEPGDVWPFRPGSASCEPDGFTGREAELRLADGTLVAREGVAFVQDGLRLFVGGHPDLPVPDVVPGDDPEDSGQKAVSLRTALVHRGVPPAGPLADLPLVTAAAGDTLWLRLVGAGDKPRQHTLTLHGLAWKAAPWVPNGPWTGSVSGVAPGWARDIVVHPVEPGDHALRTGAFRWGTEQGVWTTVRVTD